MRLPIASLSFALILLLAGVAQARPHGPGGFDGHFGVPAELGLDAETQAAVDAVVSEHRERHRALEKEARAQRDAIFELLNGEPLDREAVMAAVARLNDLEAELRSDRYAAMIDVRALLTPEQRQELVELRRRGPGRVVEACQADIESLCPDLDGSFHALRCLSRQRDALSPDCAEALPRRHGRKHPHGFGSPHRGYPGDQDEPEAGAETGSED